MPTTGNTGLGRVMSQSMVDSATNNIEIRAGSATDQEHSALQLMLGTLVKER